MTKWRLLALLPGLFLAGGFACGSPPIAPAADAGTRPGCVRGASAACACVDGEMGAQVCQPDGTFAACACTGTATDGGSAGIDGGSDAGSVATCIPGASVACACVDGETGAQICLADGTFGACACAGTGTADGGADGGLDAGMPGLCVPGASAACACVDGETGAQVCQASGTFAPCTCEGPQPDGGTNGQTGNLTGQIVIIGDQDATGTRVQLQNAGLTLNTTADSHGDYQLSGIPSGAFGLSFQKSLPLPPQSGFPDAPDGSPLALDYDATLPNLLFLPGGDGYLVDGNIYPLGRIELPAGRQLASGTVYATLSPDGSALAYITGVDQYGTGTGTLQLVGVPDGTPTMLATGVTAGNFWFTTDGKWLFYLTGLRGLVGTLFQVASRGGTPVELGTGVPPPSFYSPSKGPVVLTPDGMHAFYLTSWNGDTGSLEEVAVSGGTPVQLGTGCPWDSRGPALSLTSDGSHAFYFTNWNGLVGTLNEVDVADGNTFQLGDYVARSGNPVLTTDGSYAFFITDAESANTLYEVPVASGKPLRLDDGVTQLGLSSDGGDGFYLTQDQMLHGFTVGSGTPIELAYGVSSFLPTADGKHVFYLGGGSSGDLYEISSVGGVPVPLGVGVFNLGHYYFQLTPDGSHALYLVNWNSSDDNTGTLYAVPVEGGNPVELGTGVPSLSGSYPQDRDLRLTPDGSHAFYLSDTNASTGTGTLNEVSLVDGKRVQLATGVWTFRPTDDGAHAFYLANWIGDDWGGGIGTLYEAAVAGGAPVQLGAGLKDLYNDDFLLTPDGTHAFYLSDGLYEVNVATEAKAKLATGVTTLASDSFQLTPDGGDAFYLAGWSGTSTNGTGYLHELALGNGADVVLGSGVPAFTQQGYYGDPTSVYFLLTPDGSHAFYLAGYDGATGKLYDVSTARGTQVLVGTGVPEGYALSPDGSHVAFIASSSATAGGTLKIAPVAVGGPITLAKSVLGFAFSPDGQYLTCNLANDFWNGKTSTTAVVPAAGGAVVPINDFGSLSYVPGGVLFVRRGTPVPYDFEDGLYLTPLSGP